VTALTAHGGRPHTRINLSDALRLRVLALVHHYRDYRGVLSLVLSTGATHVPKSPKSLIEHVTFGKQRHAMADLVIQLVETARDDSPGISLWEFFMHVLIGGKMLTLHDRGREASASDLSRLTGIPRTTVQRKLLGELTKKGVVERCGHRWNHCPFLLQHATCDQRL
jgi:hypothetical protein